MAASSHYVGEIDVIVCRGTMMAAGPFSRRLAESLGFDVISLSQLRIPFFWFGRPDDVVRQIQRCGPWGLLATGPL